jgi:hypothetical protein
MRIHAYREQLLAAAAPVELVVLHDKGEMSAAAAAAPDRTGRKREKRGQDFQNLSTNITWNLYLVTSCLA